MCVPLDSFSKPGKYENIYHSITEEWSKEVFKARIVYSLTRDKAIMTDMLLGSAGVPREQDRSRVCFYGAGGFGNDLLCEPYILDTPFLIDTFRRGELRGRPILSPEQFLALPDCRRYLIVLMVGKKYEQEIAETLKMHQLNFIFFNWGEQYFDLPQLMLTPEDEYFVDIGALDGETTKRFFKRCPGGHAYVFEPCPPQFSVTENCLKRFGNRVELFPFGVSDENKTVRFSPFPENMGGSAIDPDGPIEIETRRLDDLLADRPVTFLKIDIEGSELAALRGAARIIREQKPKLAICVYHKPEDIWEIPDLILQYNPDYNLYFRHYTASLCETVLYAI